MFMVKTEVKCHQPYSLSIEVCQNDSVNKTLLNIIFPKHVFLEIGNYLRQIWGLNAILCEKKSFGIRRSSNTINDNLKQ